MPRRGTTKVDLSREYGAYILAWRGKTILFQTDWDFPGLASMLGVWAPCHNTTDGTIRCPECGKDVATMISEATDALDEHTGESMYVYNGVADYFSHD